MTAVFELTTLEIRIRSNDAVYAALQKSLPEAGGRLLGAFVPDIGDLNRLFLLREFADGNALIKARAAMHESADPLGCHEWLLSMRSRSFALFPFLPAVQVSAHGPCYEIRTYTLRQNKLAATWASWQAALPARVAMSPLIGAFSALDGDVPGIMEEPEVTIDLDEIRERGFLQAIVDNNSISYFIYKGQPMGYEYELLQSLTRYLKLELKIKVISGIEQSIDMLNKGEGDLIAFPLTVTQERTN